jgi:ferrochelatase
MAARSDYVAELRETAALVAGRLGRGEFVLAFQSRSGRPGQPWLEPDVLDELRRLAGQGARDVVVAPIGFLSDHMEVVYDLDVLARAQAEELGLGMVRAATVGTDPRFVAMIRELVLERASGLPPRWLGARGPAPDVCPQGCCLVARGGA